jgi:hypothetical protein
MFGRRLDEAQLDLDHVERSGLKGAFDERVVKVNLKVELSLVEPSAKHAATPGTQVARYLLKHVGEELHAILQDHLRKGMGQRGAFSS